MEVQEMAPVHGRVKWFNSRRGFGFMVSDQIDGDVLIHHSVLRQLGRRSVQEGDLIDCVPAMKANGLQAVRVLKISEGRAERLVEHLSGCGVNLTTDQLTYSLGRCGLKLAENNCG